MADEPASLPPRRIAGWAAMAVLIVAAVMLYFVYGRALPPLTAEPPADTSAVP
jgi:hypothetical protein